MPFSYANPFNILALSGDKEGNNDSSTVMMRKLTLIYCLNIGCWGCCEQWLPRRSNRRNGKNSSGVQVLRRVQQTCRKNRNKVDKSKRYFNELSTYSVSNIAGVAEQSNKFAFYPWCTCTQEEKSLSFMLSTLLHACTRTQF